MKRYTIRINYRPTSVYKFPHTVSISCVSGTTLQQAIAQAKSFEKDFPVAHRRGLEMASVSVIEYTIPDGE